MRILLFAALLFGCGPEIVPVEENAAALPEEAEAPQLERHRLRPMDWISADGLRIPSAWLWDYVRRRACQVRPFGDVAICVPPELEVNAINARDWEVLRLEAVE